MAVEKISCLETQMWLTDRNKVIRQAYLQNYGTYVTSQPIDTKGDKKRLVANSASMYLHSLVVWVEVCSDVRGCSERAEPPSLSHIASPASPGTRFNPNDNSLVEC